MFAVTFDDGLFQVNPETAECTLKSSGKAYPRVLGFMPGKVFGIPSLPEEVLVGYTSSFPDKTITSKYIRIDMQSWVPLLQSPTDKPGKGYTVAGDIVVVEDKDVVKSYLVVGKPDDIAHTLLLAEINPATGEFLEGFVTLPEGDYFKAQAFWGGFSYAFGTEGNFISIDMASKKVSPFTALPSKPSFLGAASRSDAPAPTPERLRQGNPMRLDSSHCDATGTDTGTDDAARSSVPFLVRSPHALHPVETLTTTA